MKFLQSTVKPEGVSLVEILKKNLGNFQEKRCHKTVHASEVTKAGFCPRKYALLDITGKKELDEWINAALQATFDVGRMTEKLVREQWLGAQAIGNWVCTTCADTRHMTTKPLSPCDTKMHICQWEYQEMRFKSQQYHVDGGMDVLVDVGLPLLVLVECKIIKAEDFDTMVAPMPEHRIRTQLYLKLIADSHDEELRSKINLAEARVLYVSRAYGKKNPETGDVLPFKEFRVKRDDTALTPYLQKAEKVVLFRTQGIMPDGICGTALDSNAKKCSCSKECFSGQYPAGCMVVSQ